MWFLMILAGSNYFFKTGTVTGTGLANIGETGIGTGQISKRVEPYHKICILNTLPMIEGA